MSRSCSTVALRPVVSDFMWKLGFLLTCIFALGTIGEAQTVTLTLLEDLSARSCPRELGSQPGMPPERFTAGIW